MLFCGQVGGDKLHRASTTNIDKRVRECAEKLCDTSLLAKLAMADLHALDAYYHRSCLLALITVLTNITRNLNCIVMVNQCQ